jgi:hypothetical protein
MAAPPDVSTVRKDLARLVEFGAVDPDWVQEIGYARLFNLPVVQARVRETAANEDAPTGEELAAAFTAAVREAVEKIAAPHYRKLLTIVLALDPHCLAGHEEMLGLAEGTVLDGDVDLRTRRTAAGKLFRGTRPSRQVTWGTIRTHHEPAALKQLAAILVRET